MTKKSSFLKKIKWLFLVGFIAINLIAYNHAYRFTHFSEGKGLKLSPEKLSIGQKIKILFVGIDNPKPVNKEKPSNEFETIYIQSHEKLEAWLIEEPLQKGIVLLFHGYSGNKSGNLLYEKEFRKLGYSTLLVDFMGSGGSGGHQTTIGIKESRDVKEAFEYAKQRYPNEEIILFGSSMGAAAIMKAMQDSQIKPTKIILECPFGTMRKTIQKRFEAMGVPSFPFADLLLLYGGFQNGFNAYKHNPIDYSKAIETPTLLLYGQRDKRVTMDEITTIFRNLKGEKKLKILLHSGHENYLIHSKKTWTKEVSDFIN